MTIRRLMATEDLAARFLEAAAGRTAQAEVHVVSSDSSNINFTAGRVRAVDAAQRVNVSLRVINNGKLGFYTTTDTSDPADAVERALEAADKGQQADFDFPGPSDGPDPNTFADETASLTQQALVSRGEALLGIVGEANPDVVVDGNLSSRIEATALLNSSGCRVARETTPVTVFLSADRVRESDVASVYSFYSACRLGDDLDRIAHDLLQTFRWAEENTSIKSGQMPVVLNPRLAQVLLMTIFMGVDGNNINRGVSPLADRLGERVLDPRISIVEDGTLDLWPSSCSHDSEGIPLRTTPIIEDGALKTFLYDLRAAAEAGVEPTGHGHRHPGYPPRVAPSNVVFRPAQQGSFQDLIADIEEGLYVEELIGVGNSNTIAGAFSNPVAMAFKIEKGEITGRVKDASIMGNVYDLLRDNLGGISAETRRFGSLEAPFILLDNVNVASK